VTMTNYIYAYYGGSSYAARRLVHEYAHGDESVDIVHLVDFECCVAVNENIYKIFLHLAIIWI
jgi:hypothetical protein